MRIIGVFERFVRRDLGGVAALRVRVVATVVMFRRHVHRRLASRELAVVMVVETVVV
jgi:hypothetical protein